MKITHVKTIVINMPMQLDSPSVKAAREVAGPDIPISIDTNCLWTVDEAIAMAHKFQAFNISGCIAVCGEG